MNEDYVEVPKVGRVDYDVLVDTPEIRRIADNLGIRYSAPHQEITGISLVEARSILKKIGRRVPTERDYDGIVSHLTSDTSLTAEILRNSLKKHLIILEGEKSMASLAFFGEKTPEKNIVPETERGNTAGLDRYILGIRLS